VRTQFFKTLTQPFGCSFVELVAAEPQKPCWYVASWNGVALVELNRMIRAHARSRRETVNTTYWICAAAMNHHSKTVTEDILEMPWRRALRHNACRGIVCAIDPKQRISSRLWCLFELHQGATRVAEEKGGFVLDLVAQVTRRGESCVLLDEGAGDRSEWPEAPEAAFPLECVENLLMSSAFTAACGDLELRDAMLNLMVFGHTSGPAPEQDHPNVLRARRLVSQLLGGAGLYSAVESAVEDRVQEMLVLQANPNSRVRGRGTPLHMASVSGVTMNVTALIEATGDVNVVNGEGHSCLTLAAQSGSEDAVFALLKARADPDHVTTERQTALDYAAGAKAQGAVRVIQHWHGCSYEDAASAAQNFSFVVLGSKGIGKTSFAALNGQAPKLPPDVAPSGRPSKLADLDSYAMEWIEHRQLARVSVVDLLEFQGWEDVTMKTADVCVVVFSHRDRASFAAAAVWADQFRKDCGSPVECAMKINPTDQQSWASTAGEPALVFLGRDSTSGAARVTSSDVSKLIEGRRNTHYAPSGGLSDGDLAKTWKEVIRLARLQKQKLEILRVKCLGGDIDAIRAALHEARTLGAPDVLVQSALERIRKVAQERVVRAIAGRARSDTRQETDGGGRFVQRTNTWQQRLGNDEDIAALRDALLVGTSCGVELETIRQGERLLAEWQEAARLHQEEEEAAVRAANWSTVRDVVMNPRGKAPAKGFRTKAGKKGPPRGQTFAAAPFARAPLSRPSKRPSIAGKAISFSIARRDSEEPTYTAATEAAAGSPEASSSPEQRIEATVEEAPEEEASEDDKFPDSPRPRRGALGR